MGKEGQEEGELGAATIFHLGGLTDTFLVGGPFFQVGDDEMILFKKPEIVRKRMMKTPGDWTSFSPARVSVDRDFQWREVTVDAAVLEFVLGIDFPTTLAGDAEGGVIENQEKPAAGLEVSGGSFYDQLRVGQILEGEDDGGVAEVSFGKGKGFLNIGDEIGVPGRGVILFGKFYQGGGEIEAGILDLRTDLASKNALAASQIKKRGVGIEVEKFEGIGQDKVLVIIMAGLTNRFFVRAGDSLPGSVFWWFHMISFDYASQTRTLERRWGSGGGGGGSDVCRQVVVYYNLGGAMAAGGGECVYCQTPFRYKIRGEK